MERLKNWWAKYSIKGKTMILVMIIMVIVLLSQSITMFLSIFAVEKFHKIMDNNSVYHNLQEVLKREQESFIVYIRNRTDENKLAFSIACENSQNCVERLPFEYEELGEERYARTWNVINGYHGYAVYRDEILQKQEADANYTNDLYDVLGMQENLSAYALKLTQVTLEQWDSVYKKQMMLFTIIPMIITWLIFLMVIYVILLWKIFSDSMIGPILKIAEDSRRISQNEFDTPLLEVKNQDEIGELVAAFNKMKSSMSHYIYTLEEKNRIAELLHKQEMEKIEIEKRFDEAQLEVLKSQVNPHFLFNTLNMISSMARLENADTTNKMIVSLGNLFRYNLHTVEQEVYLEQELDVLDDYIYIQQMRFDNRIIYEKNIEVNEKEVRIPSFTLQPIVENAFVHGVSHMEEGGKITIRIWQEEQKVIITISDNGKGMYEEQLKDINEKIRRQNTSGKGIGLGNICKRIDIMYLEGGFYISSTKDEGTIIKLVIPQNPAS